MPDPIRGVGRNHSEQADLQRTAIYVAVGCAVALTFIVVGIVAVLRNSTKKKSPSKVVGRTSAREEAPPKPKNSTLSSWRESVRWCVGVLGNRFGTYRLVNVSDELSAKEG